MTLLTTWVVCALMMRSASGFSCASQNRGRPAAAAVRRFAAPPAPVELERRAVLGAFSASVAALLAAPAASLAISATTMTGKTRPDLGIVLLDEPTTAAGLQIPIRAELLLEGGVVTTASFDAGQGFSLQRGAYYDVETKNKEGDNSFLQVRSNRCGRIARRAADELTD